MIVTKNPARPVSFSSSITKDLRWVLILFSTLNCSILQCIYRYKARPVDLCEELFPLCWTCSGIPCSRNQKPAKLLKNQRKALLPNPAAKQALGLHNLLSMVWASKKKIKKKSFIIHFRFIYFYILSVQKKFKFFFFNLN
jgi:hypothetical protein